MKRRVVILGATGSIGESALKVARSLPDKIEIVGIAARNSIEKLAATAKEFAPQKVCVVDPDAAAKLASSTDVPVLAGEAGLVDLATLPEADIVLVAIVGTAGLKPALAAIEAGKDLAVASKEILVMAGELIMQAARARGVKVLPVDSEHNAIFQCLEGRPPGDVNRLVLTCSGGPFREWPAERLAEATPAMALRHPTWTMGPKITTDSASLFNKALEMIEARWLFDMPIDKVGIVIHPQSIVHSMVEFIDGSILAQMSVTDMTFPIQYALTWPARVPGSLSRLDLPGIGSLDFAEPREDVFPALRLAREAAAACGTAPAALNAANEIAVEAFLTGRLSFPGIWRTVESVLGTWANQPSPALSEILEADQRARLFAREAIARLT